MYFSLVRMLFMMVVVQLSLRFKTLPHFHRHLVWLGRNPISDTDETFRLAFSTETCIIESHQRRLMKHIIVIAGFICLFTLTMRPYCAFADELHEEKASSPGAALELSPVNKRMALNPGEIKESHITVTNLSDSDISFSVYATPFSNGDGGETQDFETETRYTQIAHWITIKDSDGQYAETAKYTLQASEQKEIGYKVNVPDSVAGGGQYASIVVELALAPGNKNDIQTISRAGMVLIADVAGETERSAEISGIQAQVAAIGNNIGVKYTVKNKGNIDLQSSAEIVVSSVFGKELYRNSTLSLVLPENSKTVVAEWGDTPIWGIYHLEYSIAALDIMTTGSQYVLVMTPIMFGSMIVLTAGAVIAIIYLLKKHTIDKDSGLIIN